MYDHDSSLIGGPEHGSSTPTYAATPPRRMRPTAFLLQLEALDLCNEMLVLPRRSVRRRYISPLAVAVAPYLQLFFRIHFLQRTSPY
jgi:hypothetical protein